VIINIIGKGKGWQDAPLDGEIWGVNDLFVRRDVSLIFQMHDLNIQNDLVNATCEYSLKTGTPIVAQREYKHIPNIIRFPLEEMHCDYFGNSVSFMIGYAIHQGATEIHLYGCNQLAGTDYYNGKPSIEYWLGYARGLGIQVKIHGVKTTLLKTKDNILYGYLTKQER